ncbi:RNA polymerase [Jingmen Crocidura shantungensis henipavirus 1]|nr:RNA polymerase [Jingmen Crocidura shantungensis henipavirus 1]
MDFTDTSLSDVLYPECHLDSPIVAGKLVQSILYAEIPCNQLLIDETLKNTIDWRIQNGKLGYIGRTQKLYGDTLKDHINNLNKYNHVPYPECNKSLFTMYDRDISRYLENILDKSNNLYKKISHKITELLDTVEKDITGLDSRTDSQTRHIYRSLNNLSNIMENSKWYKPFLFWFTIKTEMRNIIKESKKKSNVNSTNIVKLESKKTYVQINQNLCTIVDRIQREVYHLTPEIVLMCCDVVEGRLMIQTTIRADAKFLPLLDRSDKLWELIDSLFEELGNSTYNIVSLLEPLTLGILQLQDKSLVLAGSFMHYCTTEIGNELKSNGFTNSDDINNFTRALIDIMSLDDIHCVSEFFSFFRTFGHPILEAITAAEKVRSHMQKPKMLTYLPMMKAHAIFCGIIINGYRDRHGGSWPPLELPVHATSTIRRAHSNGEALTHEMCATNWKSFCGLRFKCFMPLELDSDLSMYMKDKALSPICSEWDTVYPRENLKYSPPRLTTSRRLVDVFIDDDKFDPYTLIQYVLSGEYKTDPDFNISYSLKEKETKQAGRLFAKMTYKMRACQVVAESLIANGIGKYFKENGMVKDEHELIKNLLQLSISSVPKAEVYNDDHWELRKKTLKTIRTKTARNKNKREIDIFKLKQSPSFKMQHYGFSFVKNKSVKQQVLMNYFKNSDDTDIYSEDTDSTINDVYTNPTIKNEDKYDTISSFLTTDLQKFCLNWRYESTALFAQRMDEIYGLPGFFNWLHNRLENCVLYVADPYCPPNLSRHIELSDTEDRGIFIHKPMGGIEGYSQKLWTIITIPFLFLSGLETNTRIAAVVQGDNQSIAITYKVHPNLSYLEKKRISAERAQAYFIKLRENLAALGHNLKATETIISTHFFVYSKRIYYDGMVLSQSLKTISRCVFWSETLVDETRSACSNISTAVAKSIETGLSKDIGYGLNLLKTIQQLHISLQFSINETMTKDVVTPLINNQSWFLSACLMPAPLGGFNYLNLSRIYVRNIGDPVTASFADVKRMIKIGLFKPDILQKIVNQDSGDATYLDWASDPYSANLPSSQSITKTIKNVTARVILSNSKNPLLKGLFHHDFHNEDMELAAFLMDRSIIIPRAAHEIIENSITGAREEIAGMLDTTKGLIRTSLRKGGIQPRLISRLSHYDYEQFRFFNKLMNVKKTDINIRPEICSVELARHLRSKMWFKLTYGRLIYGLEVPDPLESMRGFTILGSELCHLCTTMHTGYCWFFIPKNVNLDKVSKPTGSIRVPYIGSTTDERSDIKLGSTKVASKALKSAIRIATVYTWAYGDDDESWIEAWYLASQRVNIDINLLKSITPISTSNNLAHRLKDRSTQVKFTGSSLNRVSRYITISNDKLEVEREDIKLDTNIIFQQVMLLGLSSIEQRFRYQTSTPNDNIIMHLHVVPNCCVIEMSNVPHVPSYLDIPVYKELIENPIIYDSNPLIESDQNKLELQYWKRGEVNFPEWTITDLHQCLSQTLALTIVDIITKSDKDVLKQFISVSSSDDINSLITEFLLVDIESFVVYLGQACALKWSFDIHYKRPLGKWQMVELLEDQLSMTSKHSFAVLNNALSHPKVFKRFWNAGILSPIYGPYLYNQDYSRLSIDLIICSYTTYLTLWLDGQSVEYLLAEQDEEASVSRYTLLQAKHLCFICDLYCNDMKPPHIRDLIPAYKIELLQDFIDTCRKNNNGVDSWNVKNLDVNVLAASTTYLRRGVIKQIRIRQDIHTDFDKMEVDLKYAKYTIETQFNYQPRNACVCLRLEEIDRPHNSIMSVKLDDSKPVNGWESHKYRRVGINSTSAYKTLDLLPYILRHYKSGTDRLYVGEGSGSILAFLDRALGPSTNYYNSGISELEVIGQRELKLYPSECCIVDKNLYDNSDLLQRIVPLFNGRPETTWIGNLDCYVHIMKTIRSHSLGLMHNDMESGMGKEPMEILVEHSHLLSLSINLLEKDGLLISKINVSNDFPITLLLSIYKYCYSNIMVAFPKYSNPYSTEVYLMCTGARIQTLCTPELLLDKRDGKSCWNDRAVINYIYTIKNRVYTAFENRLWRKSKSYRPKNDLTKKLFINKHTCTEDSQISESAVINSGKEESKEYYLGDVPIEDKKDINTQLNIRGISNKLTSDDRLLLNSGLELNGPYIVKKITGHDPGDGCKSLLDSCILLFTEVINILDQSRLPSTFFEPYPILEETRIRKYMEKFSRKITCYILLDKDNDRLEYKKKIVSNLRRGYLVWDLQDYVCTNLIPKYLRKKAREVGVKSDWVIKLDTREIKQWWKLISYSVIL